MKLNDILNRLAFWYETGTSIYLVGRVGRGKTTTMARAPALIAKARGHSPKDYGFVCLAGTLLNPPDTVGYMMARDVEGHLEAVFTRPFWYRTDEGKSLEQYKGGVILIDEADKMDVDVKKVVGEMALSGRLGPHKLPPGWVVWFAGNVAQDRSGSTKEFDHLINRRMQIPVTDCLESVLDYYAASGVHPMFTGFAKTNPQVLFEEPPPVPGPWCTPRSLHQLATYGAYLARYTNDKSIPIDPLFKEEATGKIGEGAQMHLFATLELQKIMPKFEDIVKMPKSTPIPESADAQMMVCFTLAAQVVSENMAPVIDYVDRFPSEFAICFGKAALARDVKLVTTKAMQQWAKNHGPLMMAITSI
jgi:hypothetical protein